MMNRNHSLTTVEEQVLLLWRETIGAPEASPDENFFEAGGTSLVAARLASRLTAQLETRVAAADILAHPTVRKLAARLSGQQATLDRAGSNQRASQQRNAFAVSRPARITR